MIDGTAQALIDKGIDHTKIETAYDLAKNVEKRIKLQYELQKYVDHAISSTLNLPEWGTEDNNEDKIEWFASVVKKYAGGLRGLTFYPDGSRGGQPLAVVDYEEAIKNGGLSTKITLKNNAYQEYVEYERQRTYPILSLYMG